MEILVTGRSSFLGANFRLSLRRHHNGCQSSRVFLLYSEYITLTILYTFMFRQSVAYMLYVQRGRPLELERNSLWTNIASDTVVRSSV